MRFRQRRLGWIGIDVGTSTVKIAQVARDRQGLRLTASAIVPRQKNWQTDTAIGDEAASSLHEIQAARSLQQGYQGRNVAAALPMSLCDVHRLDRDLDRESKARQLLRQTVETATQQSAENALCEYWSAAASDSQPAWSQAITLPCAWSDQLCDDIARAGWNCQTIDGLPLAVTRAVGMVHRGDPAEPIAALDWGNGRATICFVESGQPTYVRCLKDCALKNMLNALTDHLQVTELEAQRLLEEYGASKSAPEGSSDLAHLVGEIISPTLNKMVDEIKRSVSHFQYSRRASRPQQLYLFGGGAMIKELDAYLSQRLSISAQNWQLMTERSADDDVDHRVDCLLASAIALSALAWEAS